MLSLQPGTLLADKFRIERLLGAGAMGAVYVIRHELTHHRRALKLLHADARAVPEIVQRFLNEASAAGRAGNAHLVETFDAGTLPSGEPYVVMELLEGQSLSGLLEKDGPLAAARAAELVAQAAEGIEAAHAAGIIHRDLKPDNLFVVDRDGRPFVKILDFGVSKFVTDSGARLSQTRAGVVYGSPAYMSPEQLTGSLDVDARTDVFGLGVVLYQCLSGKLPFDGPTLEALSVRLLTGSLTPIETWCPNLSPAVAAVVRRALATSRDQRFPSAQAMADALRPFVSATDTHLGLERAGSVELAFAERPRPRRRPAAWAASAGVAFVVLGFASGAHHFGREREPQKPTTLASAAPSVATAGEPRLSVPEMKPLAASSTLAAAPTTSAPRAGSAKPSRGAAHSPARPPPAPVVLEPAPAAPSGSARIVPATERSAAESLGLRGDNPFR